jgi:hypothetical protein
MSGTAVLFAISLGLLIVFGLKRAWRYIGDVLRLGSFATLLGWKGTIAGAVSGAAIYLSVGIVPYAITFAGLTVVAIATYRGWRPALFPLGVAIEDDPGSQALNLRITNVTNADELTEDKLFLHGVQELDCRSWEFKEPSEFGHFATMTVYGNQKNLPYKQPRRFQLVEFEDPATPNIHVKDESNGSRRTWPIPRKGTWKLIHELRWDGGRPYRFVKYVHWSRSSAPAFMHPLRVWLRLLPANGERRGPRSLE